MKIEVKVLNKEFYIRKKLGAEYYDTPDYQTAGSAAVDLVCTEDVTIMPGETKMIPTGLAIWIGSSQSSQPVAGLVLPRSGLGTKGLILANTIGLIDSDYQGELMVSAWNRNQEDRRIAEFINSGSPSVRRYAEGLKDDGITLRAGDRFAQLMFVPVIKAQFEVVEEFSANTRRGGGGFGSTDCD